MKIIALILLLSSVLQAADRVALVVGCANYKADPALSLDTPLKDAQDLADLLQTSALGFEVVQVPDATATQFYAGLKQFKNAAQGARIAMVYFSGHGIEHDGGNFLITTNAELESPEALETETMPLEKVMKSLKDTGASVKLAVLDCCRNNPFAQTKSKSWLKTKDFVRDQVLKELGETDLPEATLVCFATSAGRKAAAVLDAQSTNSPFTDFQLQDLSTPGQSLRTIFENVHDKLKEATNGKQVPVVQTKNSVDELIRKTVLVAGAEPGPKVGGAESEDQSKTTVNPSRMPATVQTKPHFVVPSLSESPVGAPKPRFSGTGNSSKPAQGYRMWTDSKGRMVEAELVGVEGNVVILKVSSGQMFRVPLDELSKEDQKRLGR